VYDHSRVPSEASYAASVPLPLLTYAVPSTTAGVDGASLPTLADHCSVTLSIGPAACRFQRVFVGSKPNDRQLPP